MKTVRPLCPFENYADQNACKFASITHLSMDYADEETALIASNSKSI